MQSITDEQRAQWRAAALAGCPPVPYDFVERLDEKPNKIITRTAQEFFEVCRREQAGFFQSCSLERGIVVPHGKNKTRREDTGYTFRVSYHMAEQKPLL